MNPPYSAGQRSEDDNARNVAYSGLDQRIRSTYAERSRAGNLQNLYDSYIRAIRWGSDRLGESGVMAYVTSASWLDSNAMDGMRKCVTDEFDSVHVFHLRGNQRTQGEESRREGGKIFGSGSRAPIAIAVFVKNPDAKERGQILFHDIGDYLDREQKLEIVKRFGNVRGIEEAGLWTGIIPDDHGDWLDQRDASFEAYPVLGDKKHPSGNLLFRNYSLGVGTNRDAWCINPSRNALAENVESTIAFYNAELGRWNAKKRAVESTGGTLPKVDDFVTVNRTRMSWTDDLKQDLVRGKPIDVSDGSSVPCMYRPFTKQWQYFSRRLNKRVFQMPRIFPDNESPNRVIAVTGKGARSGFSALVMDTIPSLDTVDKGQCFPMWLYEAAPDAEPDMLSDLDSEPSVRRRQAITDHALDLFAQAYPTETISHENIFHYVYGLLHSEDYRSRFRANLAKELPRIPCVKSVEVYRAFRDAGQRLGELHVGYESVDPWPATIDTGGKELPNDPEVAYRVTKMRHPGTGKNKDRSSVVYNPHITIRDIPDGAWDYVVNGKPALQWVMERQCVKTDKASGIVSDANRYAIETVGDPRYPLDLFLRVITVSLETTKIVRTLPNLVIK